MKKLLFTLVVLGLSATSFAQNLKPALPASNKLPANAVKSIQYESGTQNAIGNSYLLGTKGAPQDTSLLPLSQNGKLLSVDGYEVDFKVPSDKGISNICATPSPKIIGGPKDASCGYSVPCDNAANRDISSYGTLKYFQLEWHVMMDGGPSSNIDQTRINDLMAELNADFASHNMVFCADPASFYEDAVNYTHDSNTEEVSLKTTYNVTPTQVINIYVVGSMTAGGYARFPYDPMGGTSATGGIVLNRGNCNVGTHTLAHEMGHTFGLEHTFAGVDERGQCSNCYEKVRNVNGSSNTSGVATPLGGPYNNEGDREGDWCSDTHPHDTYSYNCSTSSNANGACDSNPWANAPVNNHMSYSFCSTQFTAQQERRMHCMLDSYLGSWVSYGGGICGAQPPTADFVGTPLVWQAPSNVTFTDLSQPSQIITGWTWTFDVGAGGNGVTCAGCVGGNATFNGQVPPAVTYPNPGLYTVSLTVTSANGNDTETKVDYVEVLAPAGDCDTLTLQWENPAPTVITYGFGGGWITGVQDPANSVLPTDPKGVYERYFSPNPGVTPVGAIRVGLGSLNDLDDDMTFQVVVYDDDGGGAPGVLLGGSGAISPTQLGVPGVGFYNEFWIPILNAPVPTTGSFHVGVEMFPGDATDTLVVMTSCLGPAGCAVAQGEADASNHIWTTGFGYENLLTVYGADFDVDIIPMLGEWKPLPLITGYTENVVCDTTYVTIFDTALYSTPTGWSFTFSDGTVINSATDPGSIDRVYTTPGPDTVIVTAINDCGRADTTAWIIPYNFLETPDAEFDMTQTNPVCMNTVVDFTGQTAGYDDYFWDFGDGTTASSGGSETTTHTYTAPGTYYVELTTTVAGFLPADTFFLENFESGWPAGFLRFDNDPWTPDPAVNPPFTGTNATAWLDLDADGNGDTEAVSTSWNGGAGETADDWMITSGLGVLPAGQRLYWDAQASDVNFPDGYEVRISTTQLPANVANYNTVLFSIGAENTFNTTRSVDLSAYAGQTVYIAFRNNSDWMNLLYIDDIRIGTAAPGCNASVLKTDYVEVVDCTVNPPVADLIATPAAGCAPLSVTFTDNSAAAPDPATSWLWNFGDGTFSTAQNPPAHVYTAAGSYYVILDACNSGGCTQDTITIFVGTPPTISNVAVTDPSCIGNDGQIVITAAAGTPPLQYSIDNGVTFQASNTFTGLTGGPYDIVVEDAYGCQATTSVTLTAAPTPSITNVAVVDPTCNGGTDGSITITASGGTAPLQYSIDNGVTFQAGNVFTGLGAATYNIVVEDAAGCQATTTATLTDPPAINITNVATVDPTCNGGTDGSITITASGGTGALQYSINNGSTFQAGNIFTGLGAATYNIVVEDASGCQTTTTATLTDPPAVNITNVATTDPTCNGDTDGTIVITASGGTGALNYSIDNGVTFQGSGSFTGLGAATYNIVVQDASGCQTTTTATLTDPPLVSITNVATTDPTCNGGTDGQIVITASGGTGALSYSIDNGVTFQASNTFTGLGAATYNIVVEDAGGCQATTTATLTDPPAINITNVATVDPACNGGTDGSITITASGGTGALSYSIDNGVTFQAGNNFPGLGAATYNIVVEDASGCQVTTTATINDPAGINITNVATTDPTCNGGSDGQLVITASGGTAPLQYSIDNGVTFQAGNSFTGLGAATYNIVVEDAAGCQVSTSATLNDPPAVTYGIVITDENCGAGDGTITLTGAGGDGGPYSYSIDNGVTFQGSGSFTGLSAGPYNVVVEDGSGCQATAVETVSGNGGATITGITEDISLVCNGDCNGQLTATVTGGTLPYVYAWTDGAAAPVGGNSATITGLCADSYTLTVTDNGGAGCPVVLAHVLNEPTAVTYTSATIVDENCGQGNGSITFVGASGGDGGPYSYSIDNGVTFQASNTFTGLSAATYNVVVEDGSGCQFITTETVNNLAGPSITNVASTDPACGAGDGTITITASGGTAPLQYSIDNGVTFQAGNNFTGLAPATYNIVVEDANGCQTTTTATLTDPGAPTITNVATTDPTCGNANGDITITASGGTAPLQYSIDNGVTFQAGNTFTGLGPATYNIVVEDAVGCQTTTTATLTDVGSPTITNVATVDPTCGSTDGSITITASGGTAPLQYSIDNGVTFQAGNVFNTLGAATYNIVVQDASGCTATTTATLNNTAGPTISNVATVDPTCGNSNGSITITATGGTAPLQYSIDNGVTFQAGNSFSGLAPNTYDIVVQDANGCPITTQVTLTDPGSPTITNVAVVDPTCGNANGDITITASGGTAPLQYSIDNGVTFQASNNFTGLTPASYNIVVEDANGCQTTTIATLTDLGNPVISVVNTTDPTCGNTDGQIDISASGGTAPLQYSIDNGVTFQAGNIFTGLAGATYDVVVEDANGCQAYMLVTLTPAPTPTINNVIVTDASCGLNNGSINIQATGGTGALQYSIDNGTTFQASGIFTGLAAATYDIVVEDASGCTATTQVTLTNSPAPVISNVITVSASCGNANGEITIVATGGTGTLQYSVDNGTTFQASNVFTGLAGATYDVVVEDANGCQATTTVTIVDAGSPSIASTSITDPSCGNSNGEIQLAATGGTGPYLYSIDGGATFSVSGLFTGLTANTYNIVIEDANGCQVTTSLTLITSAPPTITIDSVVDIDCYGDTNGTVNITVNGGVAPFTYDWSNDGTGDFDDPEDLTNGTPGVVSVVVVDANGCSVLETAVINGPSDLWATATTTSEAFGNDGAIDLTVGGGTAPYTYAWSNGETTEDLTGLAGNTTYTVTVTDANGCTFILDVFVGSVVSITEMDNPMGVNVYPNPNAGQFFIAFDHFEGDVRIDVVDIAGRLVYQSSNTVKHDDKVGVDITNMASGSYTVNVMSQNATFTTRLIKR